MSLDLNARKSEIIKRWIKSIFPEDKNLSQGMDLNSLQMKNPLLFETHRDFNLIFHYLEASLNGKPGDFPPVAKTLIQLRALNSTSTRDTISYPYLLREIIQDIFLSELHENIEIFLKINGIIDNLAIAAGDFLVSIRESLYQIKINELKAGTFANETSGCPSGFLNQMEKDTKAKAV